MTKRNNKHEKRVKKLIVSAVLCAIILSVSTYAWFIGMKTVNVSAFEVKIAATESLTLSLNGADFAEELTFTKEDLVSKGYLHNTNIWPDKGLIPVSTVGKINTTSSRLTLYEKGSLTASKGGYRLMASEMKNSGAAEAQGYVAFDLFIKNLSGNAYYKPLNQENEEGIYLTPDSKVTVGNVEKKNSGIENSVRLAFAQIGRVKVGTDAGTITGITCNEQEPNDAVTGICSRQATIWEPNDMKHVQNAINWYMESCQKRDGADTFNGGACEQLTDDTYYPTYAVAKELLETDKVDTYDGTEFNTYTQTIEDGKLQKQVTFTDTDKDKKGTARPEFMYLAPNSITKVRVYVFIEGQDVDNYDFASLGAQIKVNFGFTKERFYGEDINYNSPSTTNNGPDLPPTVSARPAK